MPDSLHAANPLACHGYIHLARGNATAALDDFGAARDLLEPARALRENRLLREIGRRLGQDLSTEALALLIMDTLGGVVDFDAAGLVCTIGRTTGANASARPAVSLVWPPGTPGDYSLIVDGTATVVGSTLTVAPTGAVRHRPAADGGNDCVRLDRPGP